MCWCFTLYQSKVGNLYLFAWKQTCLMSCCTMMHWCIAISAKEKINCISFTSLAYKYNHCILYLYRWDMKTREKYDMHYIGVKGNVWHCTSDQFNAPAQSREGERSPAGVKLPGLARSCYIGLLGSGGVLPHSTEACFPPAQLATWLEDQLNLNTIADDWESMWNQNDTAAQSPLSCSGSQLVLQKVNWSPLETFENYQAS